MSFSLKSRAEKVLSSNKYATRLGGLNFEEHKKASENHLVTEGTRRISIERKQYNNQAQVWRKEKLKR